MSIFSSIKHNIRAHDRVARDYEAAHGEIFNPVEQGRLRASLAAAAGLVNTGRAPLRALDVGCGSGNLSSRLLELGFSVTAADVSEKFLDLVRKTVPAGAPLETARLNGRDLSGFADGAFDFAAAYSVLHHIPDYLAMVREMARVTASGGVLYLDHEFSPSYWAQSPEYREFLAGAGKGLAAPAPRFSRFFSFSHYADKVRQLLDPRFQVEGDLHVWPDDHVDWEAIGRALRDAGFEVLRSEDYLLFRAGYPPELHARYKGSCADQRVVAARRL